MWLQTKLGQQLAETIIRELPKISKNLEILAGQKGEVKKSEDK